MYNVDCCDLRKYIQQMLEVVNVRNHACLIVIHISHLYNYESEHTISKGMTIQVIKRERKYVFLSM